MSDESTDRVCELDRRGRLVTAEPWFDGGHPVVLESKNSAQIAQGDLALVRIPPRGRARVLRAIGPSSEIECVLEALLLERGAAWADEETTAAVDEARSVAIEPSNHSGRVDLRELPTVTIDPETARDFDDAISVRPEGSGWRAWVHVADVAAYVRSGSALDEWASARAFSTYVPGRVSPMIPEPLSAGVCSLQPDRDRWAVTVELTLDSEMSTVDTSLYRSVIRSDARLTYAEAEQMLTQTDARRPSDVMSTVRAAATVSRMLRGRRFDRGAMKLERPELQIELDGEGSVEAACWESEPESHALVEELMILANETVATFLASTNAPALYRVHPDPDPQSVVGLIRKLSALNVPTPAEPEHLTPRGAARLAARLAEAVALYAQTRPTGGEAYTGLVLRSLERARYEPVNRGHSGLASRAYCHFTSPIRRYPDVICHRTLLEGLGLLDASTPDDLGPLSEHCSERERMLSGVEHQANDICLAWLLDRVLYEEGWDAVFDAEVIGVINSGLFLRFRDVFEGYLPARAIQGDYYELDEYAVSLVGRRSGRRVRLGDEMAVRVETLDRSSGKVKLSL